MKTDYVLWSLPPEYSRDAGDPRVAGPLAILAAGGAARSTNLEVKAATDARRRARERIRRQYEEGRLKFTARTQPRDTKGKFRQVLARLKLDLGEKANEAIAKQIEAAEAAGSIGDYTAARKAGADLVSLIERAEDADLPQGSVQSVRSTNRELGRLLAYLPMPQGKDAEKVRFSDLPGPTAKLIQDLVKKVEAKLANDKAEKYVAVLKSFMSGGRTMSSDDMSVELARIVRLLA